MSDQASDGNDEPQIDIFQEPDNFYPPEKPPTTTSYTCKNGVVLNLDLIGHSPLWGHLLWNAAKVVASYLEKNAAYLVKDKTVLELGAGAGLPSLVCAVWGARKVVATDYPEAKLIQNLRYNVDRCNALLGTSTIVADGFLWGSSIAPLKAYLPQNETGFDLLILADILFNHSEHVKLVRTVREALKNDQNARALVFFTPYRPWLLENDLNFFQIAQDTGLEVCKLLECVMDTVMFENDPGDELLRRTVFGYEVKWVQSLTSPDV